MIVKNEREQWIGCSICKELVELKRKTLQNTETVLMMVEQMKEEHKGCEQYKDDPRMARLQREFAVRMRREMERAAPCVR
ncbi:MAG: hypothetical protein M3O02_11190 [Acidobacteriota bacterium]|nr:hypothetical protein [Acidobacteriota bacterium]